MFEEGQPMPVTPPGLLSSLLAKAQEIEVHFDELKEQVQDKSKVARAILRGFCGIHTAAGGVLSCFINLGA